MEQIRFSWHADDEAPRSIVDLQLRGGDDQTHLVLAQQQLPADADINALSARWEGALGRIAELA
ncbi:hypothetical protein G7085_10065 [Tessaracoccus sp. HDW20]|uniref:SRPBCC domain-containing protein n=1 Tax=Tessaracoccus coleopterorum TaxID=2714950 RepID=UPI0018D43810|nr:SRPBCC domain-containing protein [Tessaracoccus coleopterorum]NHB84824.1 hypothetical protein [Tessaracoccus coleopterorum]